jgi:hypothetical protein
MPIIAVKTTAPSTQLNAKPSKTSSDPEKAAEDVKCRYDGKTVFQFPHPLNSAIVIYNGDYCQT